MARINLGTLLKVCIFFAYSPNPVTIICESVFFNSLYPVFIVFYSVPGTSTGANNGDCQFSYELQDGSYHQEKSCALFPRLE